MLCSEPLTSRNLDEVIEFFHRSNPFAQKTWGWDSGRFIDWRWGSNTLREATSPGWFSKNCRVFRHDGLIRAALVSEYGHEDVCVITGGEDPEAVRVVLDWLDESRVGSGIGFSFEFSDTAEWLRDVFRTAGLRERAGTGHEWEYDLGRLPDSLRIPEGFTIESLTDDRSEDRAGIAECVRTAFNATHDVQAALRSLEENPMFHPDLSVFARSPDGRIAAYCRGTVNPINGVCGIDPVCCHPDYQRMGLSKAVVQSCFLAQGALGGRFCYIGSASEPAPSTFLYRSLGPTARTFACTWSRP